MSSLNGHTTYTNRLVLFQKLLVFFALFLLINVVYVLIGFPKSVIVFGIFAYATSIPIIIYFYNSEHNSCRGIIFILLCDLVILFLLLFTYYNGFIFLSFFTLNFLFAVFFNRNIMFEPISFSLQHESADDGIYINVKYGFIFRKTIIHSYFLKSNSSLIISKYPRYFFYNRNKFYLNVIYRGPNNNEVFFLFPSWLKGNILFTTLATLSTMNQINIKVLTPTLFMKKEFLYDPFFWHIKDMKDVNLFNNTSLIPNYELQNLLRKREILNALFKGVAMMILLSIIIFLLSFSIFLLLILPYSSIFLNIVLISAVTICILFFIRQFYFNFKYNFLYLFVYLLGTPFFYSDDDVTFVRFYWRFISIEIIRIPSSVVSYLVESTKIYLVSMLTNLQFVFLFPLGYTTTK